MGGDVRGEERRGERGERREERGEERRSDGEGHEHLQPRERVDRVQLAADRLEQPGQVVLGDRQLAPVEEGAVELRRGSSTLFFRRR
tara:strand:- start:851 stop:1111 length:261 start_codon:yes stop_codon:yes gene_type:complete